MATKEHYWHFVKKNVSENSSLPHYYCLLDLLERVEVLEAKTNEFITGLDLATEILESGNENSENLRQQDEDVKRVAADPHHVATDEELAVRFADAAKVAILEHKVFDKALTSADISKAQYRALYDLGRHHAMPYGLTREQVRLNRAAEAGKAAADAGIEAALSVITKSTPNDLQIGSSADTGLLPMIVSETGSDDEPEIERIICSAISGGADYVNGMPRELSLERIRYGDGSQRISARYVQAPDDEAEPTHAPAGALKESLTNVWNEGFLLRRYAATEVLILVASWLQQRTDTIANGSQWADLLREEAGR